uniref:UPAR/Ly6 domain-containing protein qvr n=1 Tax=Macrostomum lignano TaxID=282301 RepID=A0A1I8GV85_9PLAT
MNCTAKFLLILVQLVYAGLSMSSFASDPDHCKDQNMDCVECDSLYDSRCRDPFDVSLVKRGLVPSVRCGGVCSKWVHRYADGSSRVRRTCSKNLRLKKVSPYLVCIDESRRNGQLCFCDKRNCNAAVALKAAGFSSAVVSVMLLLLWSIRLELL